MKQFVAVVAIALLGFSGMACSGGDSVSKNGCLQVCADKNRQEVQLCNYPQTDVETTKKCLATARNNFDSCKQACGKYIGSRPNASWGVRLLSTYSVACGH